MSDQQLRPKDAKTPVAQEVEPRAEAARAAGETLATTPEEQRRIDERNRKQAAASARSLENTDTRDASDCQGVYTSREAEDLLRTAAPGTWVLRVDPSKHRTILSVKDGDSVIGHYETDADSALSSVLRYRVDPDRALHLAVRPVDPTQNDDPRHKS